MHSVEPGLPGTGIGKPFTGKLLWLLAQIVAHRRLFSVSMAKYRDSSAAFSSVLV